MSQRPRMPRQGTARDRAAGRQAAPRRPGAVAAKGTAVQLPGLRRAAERASAIAAEWTPTVSRMLLGLVLAWFGYHELVRPGEWTGYVPVFSPGSSLAIVLVLGLAVGLTGCTRHRLVLRG